MVMRQWSADPSVTQMRRVQRELELDVMPGYRWFAEAEAVRLGVPPDVAPRPRIRPSTNPRFTPGTATFRWEWWAVVVDDG